MCLFIVLEYKQIFNKFKKKLTFKTGPLGTHTYISYYVRSVGPQLSFSSDWLQLGLRLGYVMRSSSVDVCKVANIFLQAVFESVDVCCGNSF